MIALKKILVPTDFGEAADAALTYARALARNFGSSIEVLHVAEDVSARMFAGEAFVAIPATLQNDVEEMARKQLDERLIDNDPEPLPTRPIVVTSNAPAQTIVNYATGDRRRPDRHGHARPHRDDAPADGQRGRAGRAPGWLPGARRPASRA